MKTSSTLGDLLLKRYVADFIAQVQSFSIPLYSIIGGGSALSEKMVVWTDGEWGIVHDEPYWAMGHRHPDEFAKLKSIITAPPKHPDGGYLLGEHKELMYCMHCMKDVPKEVQSYYGLFIMDVPEENCFPRLPK